MKNYLDEDEYLEDIYGDEIKPGDIYYIYKLNKYDYEAKILIHNKNLIQFALEELDLKMEER